MRLGEKLLKENLVTPEQLKKAVEYQGEHPETMLGNALIDLGFLSEEAVNDALGRQEEDRTQVSVPPEQGVMAVKLGEKLLMDNAITEEQLRKALEYQEENPGTMIGQTLVSLGFVTPNVISEALQKSGKED